MIVGIRSHGFAARLDAISDLHFAVDRFASSLPFGNDCAHDDDIWGRGGDRDVASFLAMTGSGELCRCTGILRLRLRMTASYYFAALRMTRSMQEIYSSIRMTHSKARQMIKAICHYN